MVYYIGTKVASSQTIVWNQHLNCEIHQLKIFSLVMTNIELEVTTLGSRTPLPFAFEGLKKTGRKSRYLYQEDEKIMMVP